MKALLALRIGWKIAGYFLFKKKINKFPLWCHEKAQRVVMTAALPRELECCKNLRGKRDATGYFKGKNHVSFLLRDVSECCASPKLPRAERESRDFV